MRSRTVKSSDEVAILEWGEVLNEEDADEREDGREHMVWYMAAISLSDT